MGGVYGFAHREEASRGLAKLGSEAEPEGSGKRHRCLTVAGLLRYHKGAGGRFFRDGRDRFLLLHRSSR